MCLNLRNSLISKGVWELWFFKEKMRPAYDASAIRAVDCGWHAAFLLSCNTFILDYFRHSVARLIG